MMRVKILPLLLALLLIVSLLGACGTPAPVSEAEEASAPSAEEAQSVLDSEPAIETEEEPESAEEAEELPVEENAEEPMEEPAPLPEPGADFPLVDAGSESISFWYVTPPFASMMGDYADNNTWNLFRTLSEMTGLTFEFTYAPWDSASESFSLLVAGGDYTDVLCGNRYTSGVDAAIEDDVYLRLNDLIDEYCPFYNLQLQRPEVKRDAFTEAGNIGVFYDLYDADTTANSGIGVNEDVFAETGVAEPETYDDYEVMFEAMKNLGVKDIIIQTPFHQIIASGYYNIEDWVVIDGKVQYGLVNENSKEFYTRMADWYQKGYLMSDYYTSPLYANQNGVFAELADHSGGIMMAMADAIGSYPESKIKPLHIMVREHGDVVHTYQRNKVLSGDNGWEISTACDEEKQVYIAKMVDYLYSDPGKILVTWGEEGLSFEYDENGDAQYIDAIFNEYPIPMCAYLKYASMDEVGLSDVRKVNYGFDENELAAVDLWAPAQDNDALYPTTSLTVEERDVVSRYYADAETYIVEYVNTLINGSQSIDTWDDFITTLNDTLHFDEVVAVKQAAYDRYMQKLDE